MESEKVNCLDIYRERPVRLTVRALVPVKEHPKVSVTEGQEGPPLPTNYFYPPDTL